jgi:hypothetical protein
VSVQLRSHRAATLEALKTTPLVRVSSHLIRALDHALYSHFPSLYSQLFDRPLPDADATAITVVGSQAAAMQTGGAAFAPKRLRQGCVQRLYVTTGHPQPKGAKAGDVVTGYLLLEDYGHAGITGSATHASFAKAAHSVIGRHPTGIHVRMHIGSNGAAPAAAPAAKPASDGKAATPAVLPESPVVVALRSSLLAELAKCKTVLVPPAVDSTASAPAATEPACTDVDDLDDLAAYAVALCAFLPSASSAATSLEAAPASAGGWQGALASCLAHTAPRFKAIAELLASTFTPQPAAAPAPAPATAAAAVVTTT